MGLRLGIIGSGSIGTMHAEMATAVGTQVVAVCDKRPERAKKLAAKIDGAVAAASADELLARRDVDAVVVCVPNDRHKPLALKAIAAGKDLLLEKPMALNVAECDEIIAAAKKSDRIVQMGFVCRCAPTSVAIREMIRAGRFGEIYHAKAILHRRRGVPGLGRWFTTKAKSGGGVLIDLGVHVIDLVTYLADRPRAVRVSGHCTSRFGTPIERYVYDEMWAGPPNPEGVFDVEDGATALIRFDSGLTLDLSVSWAANLPETVLPDGIILFGEKAGCYFDVWGERVEIATEQDGYLVDLKPRIHTAGTTWADGWQRQHRIFAANVQSRRAPDASLADGRAVQQILEAIYASSDAGREVEIG